MVTCRLFVHRHPRVYVELQLYLNVFLSECTDIILTNAKEKKQEWKAKLATMELDSLCQCRDALLAQGVLFSMISVESDGNLKSIAKEVS